MLRPPGVELDHPRELPTIYVIQGYTGQNDMWMGRKAFEPTFIERMDAMLASDECPDAIVVMVDCWTSYGGSQFLDSIASGPYQSYLCDEIVPFVDDRYPTAADREHRGITGKSSGGYGAMVVPMMRPDVFSALASHAGDALFEVSMTPGIRDAPSGRSATTTSPPTTSSSSSCPRRTRSTTPATTRSRCTATPPPTHPTPTGPARRCCPST